MTDLKSMTMFFIDNAHSWPKGAQLHQSLVFWPDHGKYPTYVPVAMAEHPQFNGKVVVQAGNRGLVVSFVAGAQSAADVQKGMSEKGLEQYRVALDSIVHAIMLKRAESEGSDGDVHPLTLLSALARISPKEATVIAQALLAWVKKPTAAAGEDLAAQVQSADEMLTTLNTALNQPEAE